MLIFTQTFENIFCKLDLWKVYFCVKDEFLYLFSPFQLKFFKILTTDKINIWQWTYVSRTNSSCRESPCYLGTGTMLVESLDQLHLNIGDCVLKDREILDMCLKIESTKVHWFCSSNRFNRLSFINKKKKLNAFSLYF